MGVCLASRLPAEQLRSQTLGCISLGTLSPTPRVEGLQRRSVFSPFSCLLSKLYRGSCHKANRALAAKRAAFYQLLTAVIFVKPLTREVSRFLLLLPQKHTVIKVTWKPGQETCGKQQACNRNIRVCHLMEMTQQVMFAQRANVKFNYFASPDCSKGPWSRLLRKGFCSEITERALVATGKK